jgi:hypothetical protein
LKDNRSKTRSPLAAPMIDTPREAAIAAATEAARSSLRQDAQFLIPGPGDKIDELFLAMLEAAGQVAVPGEPWFPLERLVARALAGDERLRGAMLRFAADELQHGRALLPPLAAYIESGPCDGQSGVRPGRRAHQPFSNFYRDYVIARAVMAAAEKGRLDYTRNRASHGKDQSPSACWIVHTVLHEMGISAAEQTIEQILAEMT